MKKKLNNLLLLIPFALIIYGCEKDVISFESTNNGVVPTVSFKNDLVPLFQSRCITCHNTVNGTNPNLSVNAYQNLTGGGFINTSNPAQSLIYVKITSGSMAGYSNNTLDLIRSPPIKGKGNLGVKNKTFFTFSSLLIFIF